MKYKIHRLAVVAVVFAAAFSSVTAQHRVVGSGHGGNSPWATDHYPGFEGLDNLPTPEKKEKGWIREWLGIGAPKGASASEQLAIAAKYEEKGDFKDAAEAYDKLVREWPASSEAATAQFRLATVLENNLAEYADAYEEYAYLLDFYPNSCDLAKIAEAQYKLVNLLHDTRKMFLGMSFTGNRELRQSYERIVRRTPGADYVPQALLKIANLRELDADYEDAIQVYSTLRSRYIGTNEARAALYLEAKARMWLVRRLAYNHPRCKDTENYLKLALRNDPSHPNAEEMRTWLKDLSSYLSEDAWKRAKFYDSRQRTRHAAIASYTRFIAEHPDSVHVEEARARIAELNGSDKEGKSK
ncbi:MAG: tetratricopeptide repeat protein [Kiritimatiellae bacterium]|nr:tetratricopeptide repeat protein [Kiritimatiellia bacterium]